MTVAGKKSERGNALLEFALGFAVLWAVFSGLYQFGYSFYAYNALMTSVANAAQLGAKMSYDTGSPSRYSDAVTNMVVYGTTTPATGASPIVPGLSSSNVSLNLNLKNSIPTYVSISISNFAVDCVFTKFTFKGKPRATAVYMGQIICSSC